GNFGDLLDSHRARLEEVIKLPCASVNLLLSRVWRLDEKSFGDLRVVVESRPAGPRERLLICHDAQGEQDGAADLCRRRRKAGVDAENTDGAGELLRLSADGRLELLGGRLVVLTETVGGKREEQCQGEENVSHGRALVLRLPVLDRPARRFRRAQPLHFA